MSAAVLSPSLDTLDKLDKLFRTTIAPQAAQLDRDSQALGRAFRLLGEHGVLGLKASTDWGGLAWDSGAVYGFTERLAR